MADLPRSEAEPLIAMRKVIRGDFFLTPRKNHAGYLSSAMRPDDEFDATIPGMTVEIEIKAPLLIDACKNIVSIYLLRGRVKYRVYQLEVQPPSKRSHNEPGNTLFGPHEHIGNEVAPYEGPNVSCSTPMNELLAIFCAKANISFTGQLLQQ